MEVDTTIEEIFDLETIIDTPAVMSKIAYLDKQLNDENLVSRSDIVSLESFCGPVITEEVDLEMFTETKSAMNIKLARGALDKYLKLIFKTFDDRKQRYVREMLKSLDMLEVVRASLLNANIVLSANVLSLSFLSTSENDGDSEIVLLKTVKLSWLLTDLRWGNDYILLKLKEEVNIDSNTYSRFVLLFDKLHNYLIENQQSNDMSNQLLNGSSLLSTIFKEKEFNDITIIELLEVINNGELLAEIENNMGNIYSTIEELSNKWYTINSINLFTTDINALVGYKYEARLHLVITFLRELSHI